MTLGVQNTYQARIHRVESSPKLSFAGFPDRTFLALNTWPSIYMPGV